MLAEMWSRRAEEVLGVAGRQSPPDRLHGRQAALIAGFDGQMPPERIGGKPQIRRAGGGQLTGPCGQRQSGYRPRSHPGDCSVIEQRTHRGDRVVPLGERHGRRHIAIAEVGRPGQVAGLTERP